MFRVFVTFDDGREERQGAFNTREEAEARVASLKGTYHHIECRIVETGKVNRLKVRGYQAKHWLKKDLGKAPVPTKRVFSKMPAARCVKLHMVPFDFETILRILKRRR